MSPLEGGEPVTPLPWIADPTAGYNKYDYGCEYMSDLLVPRDDGKPGFSLKAMRPSSLEAYTGFNQPGFGAADEAYTLRLESDDLFNGGLFAISVDWLPYGGGAWPAFWMVRVQSMSNQCFEHCELDCGGTENTVALRSAPTPLTG